jgi:hypothetical protein
VNREVTSPLLRALLPILADYRTSLPLVVATGDLISADARINMRFANMKPTLMAEDRGPGRSHALAVSAEQAEAASGVLETKTERVEAACAARKLSGHNSVLEPELVQLFTTQTQLLLNVLDPGSSRQATWPSILVHAMKGQQTHRMRRFEFAVSSVSVAPGGRLTLVGRCSAGPLWVNDLFAAAEQRELVKGASEWSSRTTDSRSAKAAVLEIRAYGQVLSSVEAGTTAELLVEPITPDVVVREDDVLVGQADAEP